MNELVLFKFEYANLVHKIRQNKIDIKNASRELSKQPIERDKWGYIIYKSNTPRYMAIRNLERIQYVRNDLRREMEALLLARQNARVEAETQWLSKHISNK